uniref:Uncharacterized protein n=1 Tax=Callorhinchus milii TaxID=7868 RepID=V9KEQ6_CALMI
MKEDEPHTQEVEPHTQEAWPHMQEVQLHIQEAQAHTEEVELQMQEAELHMQVVELHIQQDEPHLQKAEPHIQEVESYTQDVEPHTQEGELHTQEVELQMQEAELHTQEFEAHMQQDEPQMQEVELHMQDVEPQTQEVEPHTQEDEPYTQEDEPQMQEAEPHIQEAQAHMQEVEPQLQKVEPHIQEVESHLQEVEPYLQEAEPHTQEVELHMQEDESHTQEAELHMQELELEMQEVVPHTHEVEPHVQEVTSETFVANKDRASPKVLCSNEVDERGNDLESEMGQLEEGKTEEHGIEKEFEIPEAAADKVQPEMVSEGIEDLLTEILTRENEDTGKEKQTLMVFSAVSEMTLRRDEECVREDGSQASEEKNLGLEVRQLGEVAQEQLLEKEAAQTSGVKSDQVPFPDTSEDHSTEDTTQQSNDGKEGVGSADEEQFNHTGTEEMVDIIPLKNATDSFEDALLEWNEENEEFGGGEEQRWITFADEGPEGTVGSEGGKVDTLGFTTTLDFQEEPNHLSVDIDLGPDGLVDSKEPEDQISISRMESQPPGTHAIEDHSEDLEPNVGVRKASMSVSTEDRRAKSHDEESSNSSRSQADHGKDGRGDLPRSWDQGGEEGDEGCHHFTKELEDLELGVKETARDGCKTSGGNSELDEATDQEEIVLQALNGNDLGGDEAWLGDSSTGAEIVLTIAPGTGEEPDTRPQGPRDKTPGNSPTARGAKSSVVTFTAEEENRVISTHGGEAIEETSGGTGKDTEAGRACGNWGRSDLQEEPGEDKDNGKPGDDALTEQSSAFISRAIEDIEEEQENLQGVTADENLPSAMNGRAIDWFSPLPLGSDVRL